MIQSISKIHPASSSQPAPPSTKASHSIRSSICQHCNAIFDSYRDLISHIKTQHVEVVGWCLPGDVDGEHWCDDDVLQAIQQESASDESNGSAKGLLVMVSHSKVLDLTRWMVLPTNQHSPASTTGTRKPTKKKKKSHKVAKKRPPLTDITPAVVSEICERNAQHPKAIVARKRKISNNKQSGPMSKQPCVERKVNDVAQKVKPVSHVSTHCKSSSGNHIPQSHSTCSGATKSALVPPPLVSITQTQPSESTVSYIINSSETKTNPSGLPVGSLGTSNGSLSSSTLTNLKSTPTIDNQQGMFFCYHCRGFFNSYQDINYHLLKVQAEKGKGMASDAYTKEKSMPQYTTPTVAVVPKSQTVQEGVNSFLKAADSVLHPSHVTGPSKSTGGENAIEAKRKCYTASDKKTKHLMKIRPSLAGMAKAAQDGNHAHKHKKKKRKHKCRCTHPSKTCKRHLKMHKRIHEYEATDGSGKDFRRSGGKVKTGFKKLSQVSSPYLKACHDANQPMQQANNANLDIGQAKKQDVIEDNTKADNPDLVKQNWRQSTQTTAAVVKDSLSAPSKHIPTLIKSSDLKASSSDGGSSFSKEEQLKKYMFVVKTHNRPQKDSEASSTQGGNNNTPRSNINGTTKQGDGQNIVKYVVLQECAPLSQKISPFAPGPNSDASQLTRQARTTYPIGKAIKHTIESSKNGTTARIEGTDTEKNSLLKDADQEARVKMGCPEKTTKKVSGVSDENSSSAMDQTDSNIDTNASANIFQCFMCGKSYTQRHNLVFHIRKHHPLGNKTHFKCSICHLKWFSTTHSLNEHMKTEHEASSSKLSPVVPTFYCHLCCKVFKKWSDLNSHVETQHENERRYCFVCGKRFACRVLMESHILQTHKACCRYCLVELKDEATAEAHEQKSHAQKYFPRMSMHNMRQPCVEQSEEAIVNSKTTAECKLPKDASNNGTEKPVKSQKPEVIILLPCQFCDKTFEYLSVLEAHQQHHHPNVAGKFCSASKSGTNCDQPNCIQATVGTPIISLVQTKQRVNQDGSHQEATSAPQQRSTTGEHLLAPKPPSALQTVGNQKGNTSSLNKAMPQQKASASDTNQKFSYNPQQQEPNLSKTSTTQQVQQVSISTTQKVQQVSMNRSTPPPLQQVKPTVVHKNPDTSMPQLVPAYYPKTENQLPKQALKTTQQLPVAKSPSAQPSDKVILKKGAERKHLKSVSDITTEEPVKSQNLLKVKTLLPCHYCDKKFEYLSVLEAHQQCHHVAGTYISTSESGTNSNQPNRIQASVGKPVISLVQTKQRVNQDRSHQAATSAHQQRSTTGLRLLVPKTPSAQEKYAPGQSSIASNNCRAHVQVPAVKSRSSKKNVQKLEEQPSTSKSAQVKFSVSKNPQGIPFTLANAVNNVAQPLTQENQTSMPATSRAIQNASQNPLTRQTTVISQDVNNQKPHTVKAMSCDSLQDKGSYPVYYMKGRNASDPSYVGAKLVASLPKESNKVAIINQAMASAPPKVTASNRVPIVNQAMASAPPNVTASNRVPIVKQPMASAPPKVTASNRVPIVNQAMASAPPNVTASNRVSIIKQAMASTPPKVTASNRVPIVKQLMVSAPPQAAVINTFPIVKQAMESAPPNVTMRYRLPIANQAVASAPPNVTASNTLASTPPKATVRDKFPIVRQLQAVSGISQQSKNLSTKPTIVWPTEHLVGKPYTLNVSQSNMLPDSIKYPTSTQQERSNWKPNQQVAQPSVEQSHTLKLDDFTQAQPTTSSEILQHMHNMMAQKNIPLSVKGKVVNFLLENISKIHKEEQTLTLQDSIVQYKCKYCSKDFPSFHKVKYHEVLHETGEQLAKLIALKDSKSSSVLTP